MKTVNGWTFYLHLLVMSLIGMDMMSNNKLYMIIISDFKIQRKALVVKKLCKLEVFIRISHKVFENNKH